MQEKVRILEQHLKDNEDFGEISDYYFTHFGEKQWFSIESKKVRIEILEQLFFQAIRNTLDKKELAITNPMFLFHEPSGLFHGHAMIEEHIAIFVFSKKITIGLCCITNINTNYTNFIRVKPEALDGKEQTLKDMLDDDKLKFNWN